MEWLDDELFSTPLSNLDKGIPAIEAPIALERGGELGWNVARGDVTLPALTIRDRLFGQNLQSMRELVEGLGLSLAPHGKTPMAPQLFTDMENSGGAWGISVATVQQAAVAASGGIRNVIIANQVVGPANVKKLASLRAAFPGRGLSCFIDSAAALEYLASHGGQFLNDGDRFDILVEVGDKGGRTGARSWKQVDEIIDAAKQRSSIVRVVGVGCYEGAIDRPDAEEERCAVDAYLEFAVDAFNRVAESGLFAEVDKAILTGGGSAWFDRVAAVFSKAKLIHPARRILRCGSYAFMDHRIYRQKLAAIDDRGGLPGPVTQVSAQKAFQPALELWAAVQSIRDPGRAIIAMGKRDLPYDQGLPIPLRLFREGKPLQIMAVEEEANPFEIETSDDQHAYMAFPEGHDVRVGDIFAFGISHPCTAFDKWRIVFRVDEESNVTGIVRTFF